MPTTPAKRPVGRPRKRAREEPDDNLVPKRLCLDVSDMASDMLPSVVADVPNVVADVPSVVADVPSVVDDTDMPSLVPDTDMSSFVDDPAMPSLVEDTAMPQSNGVPMSLGDAPANYSELQPLDVSLNKPFKTHVRKSWCSFIRSSMEKLCDGEIEHVN